MAVFHSAKALANHQQARFERVHRKVRVLHAEMAEFSRVDALKLTSGDISSKELARRGHPFGRKKFGAGGKVQRSSYKRFRLTMHAGGLVISTPKLPINAQTGRLQRSLRVFRRSLSTGQVLDIQFTARHATFVLSPTGTKRMVPRGFWPEMKRLSRIHHRNLRQRIRLEALREGFRANVRTTRV